MPRLRGWLPSERFRCAGLEGIELGAHALRACVPSAREHHVEGGMVLPRPVGRAMPHVGLRHGGGGQAARTGPWSGTDAAQQWA